MKKTLLALAVVSFAGAASAQSSVTLFGIIDAAYGHMSAGGRSASGITNSGINSSRLGVRGVEDLGGGLQAGFWLEGQLNNDVGQGGSQTSGLDFRRRATVSLMGKFGELRIGRDYNPVFWNTTIYDPFGTVGVGSSNTFAMIGAAGAGNSTNAVRSDNTIGYFLPALGGLNGQVMYAFGENTGGVKTNNFFGFRVGYAAGPFAANYAYGKTEGATDAADTKYSNIGGSYNLGAVKPMFQWTQEKAGNGAKVTGWLIGLTAPLGQGELRAAYSDYNIANSSNDWNKMGIGYVYNLSKRSAMYVSYARVSNDGAQTRSVSSSGLSAGAASPGGSSSGYEFGVRHIF